jgi:DNA polymerase-4
MGERNGRKMKRVIFHSDLNNFYASVEAYLQPELRGKPIAVCGSSESRHGIVLAKSEQAKKGGVKTGMTVWEAKKICPTLCTVPPHFEQYLRFSSLVRQIYLRYTDCCEPFGIDECWLDMTGTMRFYRGSAYELADEIRRTVKNEIGLTVSIGVSFCKVFAKLGSDRKKPDAITEITEQNFRAMVWPLSVSELLYVGPTIFQKLQMLGVDTIGKLAVYPLDCLREKFGKQGQMIWNFANGIDPSPVVRLDEKTSAKSISHGLTACVDLKSREELWHMILLLAQKVGRQLQKCGLSAQGVSLAIRKSDFSMRSWETCFSENKVPTQNPLVLAKAAYQLFLKKGDSAQSIRAVTITAIRLVPENGPFQIDLLGETETILRKEKLSKTISTLQERYGDQSICPATLLQNQQILDPMLGFLKNKCVF